MMQLNASNMFYVVMLVSLLLANASFFTTKLFALVKTTALNRAVVFLLNFALCFVLLALVLFLLERSTNVPQRQNWEFYASSICFFLILATPGFIFKRLYKKLS